MIYLNFLPWREAARQRIKRNFFYSVMTVTVIMILLSVTYGIYVKQQYQKFFSQKSQQESTLSGIQQQATQVYQLQQQLEYINKQTSLLKDILAKNQINLLLFQILMRTIPSNVYLTNFQREDDEIILQGRSESSLLVSKFLQNLRESTCFSALTIRHLDKDNSMPAFSEIFEIELIENRV
jgi:type IV pilus assembly protein PilN